MKRKDRKIKFLWENDDSHNVFHIEFVIPLMKMSNFQFNLSWIERLHSRYSNFRMREENADKSFIFQKIISLFRKLLFIIEIQLTLNLIFSLLLINDHTSFRRTHKYSLIDETSLHLIIDFIRIFHYKSFR